MPVNLDGKFYVTMSEAAEQLGVARQTLWRWRKEGRIPPGRRYRGREVIFTSEEVEEARQYANRVEPIHDSTLRVESGEQLRLFNGGRS